MGKKKEEEVQEANVLDEAMAATSPEDVAGLNIYQRMFKAAGLISVLVKRDKNDFQKYRYVSHDDVAAKVRQVFQVCGILAIMDIPEYHLETYTTTAKDGNRQKETLNVLARIVGHMTFINPDQPEDRYTVTIPAYALDTSDKALGKAVSYAKKYALIALCGLMLATGDDQDQDANEMADLAKKRAEQSQGAGEEGQETPQGATERPQDGRSRTSGGNTSAGAGSGAHAGTQKAADNDPDFEDPDKLIAAHQGNDFNKLAKPLLVALGDAFAFKLGGGTAWVKAHLKEDHGSWSKAPKEHVVHLVVRLESVYCQWLRLKDMAIEYSDGDEAKAKAVLVNLKKARNWPPLYQLDPAELEVEIQAWRDAEGPVLD